MAEMGSETDRCKNRDKLALPFSEGHRAGGGCGEKSSARAHYVCPQQAGMDVHRAGSSFRGWAAA